MLGDSEWAALEEPERQVMTVVNNADGIFTAQMDIHLRVERHRLLAQLVELDRQAHRSQAELL